MGKVKYGLIRGGIALFAALLASIGIVACSSEPAGPSSSEITEPRTTAGERQKAKGALSFDQTAETDNRIKVKLSDFQRGMSSQTAYPSYTEYVSFRVWISNGSEKPLDLTLLTAGCMYGNPAQPAEEIFDSERGLHGTPTTTLLAGDTARVTLACALPEHEKYIRIQIDPDWADNSAIFAGAVD